jgi:hypothetical protein
MYQFVHVESYSRATPKKASSTNKKTGKSSSKSGGHCVSYIVKEATRDVNAIPHIENPAPPTYVYGEPLEALEATCNAWAESLKDARGHALRKDALCLLAGIVSAPKDITPQAWQAFETDSVKWLKDKYGAALRTVVAHHDESHPHLHFYVVPELGQRFESVHQGREAAALVKAQGGLKGLQNQAYKAAMRDYQNEFYNKVGIEHGFTRIGPAKRRLTREEWKLEQLQAEAAAQAIAKARDITEVSKASSEQMIEVAKEQAQEIAKSALKQADLIEKEAEKRGWQKALDSFEQLPWFKRVRTVVSRAIEQRDELREQLKQADEERKTLRAENESLLSKAKRFFTAGKAANERVKELEPALFRAQMKAQEAERLRAQNEQLESALSSERSRSMHLALLNEALQPKAAEPEKITEKRKKQVQESALER